MAMTDWTIIRRSMTARLFSTVTTALTVAVAVALIFTLLVMRDSGRRAFERGSGNMHMVLGTEPSALDVVLNHIFYAGNGPKPIEFAQYKRIITSFPLDFAIATQRGDSYEGMPVMAASDEFFTKFEPVAGEPWSFARGGRFEKSWEVVVGSRAARTSGLKLGDEIVLTHGSGLSREQAADGAHAGHVHSEFKYKVVGILNPTGSAHDRALFTNLTSSWIIHAFDRRELAEHEEAAKEASSAAAKGEATPTHADEHDEPPVTEKDITDADRRITAIYMRVATRPGSDASSAMPQILTALQRGEPITVAQPDKEIKKLFAIVGNIDQILVGMAVCVMVAGGISIMIALYNSMEQRRRQIAILRVLGCSRPRVFGLIVTEAAIVGLLGAAAGIVLGVGGAAVTAQIMRARLGLIIQPLPSAEMVPILVLATVLLGAVAGVIPAMMAYRTPVAKNLRPVG